MQKAAELDCEHLATGHYARICSNPDTGNTQLTRPQDLRKDQTYFLFATTKDQLNYLRFPLGNYTKNEVREIAK